MNSVFHPKAELFILTEGTQNFQTHRRRHMQPSTCSPYRSSLWYTFQLLPRLPAFIHLKYKSPLSCSTTPTCSINSQRALTTSWLIISRPSTPPELAKFESPFLFEIAISAVVVVLQDQSSARYTSYEVDDGFWTLVWKGIVKNSPFVNPSYHILDFEEVRLN